MKRLLLAIIVSQLSTIGCHTHSPGSSYANGVDAAPFRATHLRVGTHPTMVGVVDANRDGNMDIVVANGGSGDVSVFLGWKRRLRASRRLTFSGWSRTE